MWHDATCMAGALRECHRILSSLHTESYRICMRMHGIVSQNWITVYPQFKQCVEWPEPHIWTTVYHIYVRDELDHISSWASASDSRFECDKIAGNDRLPCKRPINRSKFTSSIYSIIIRYKATASTFLESCYNALFLFTPPCDPAF